MQRLAQIEANCTPGRGDTVSFWEDLINGRIHSSVYPNLLVFAKDQNISLWKLKSADDLLSCFRIPMTRQAYNEFLDLQSELASMAELSPSDKDVWTFTWGQPNYSSSTYYQYQFRNLQADRSFSWIWKSKCVPKIKFFSWLLLNDRLNMRNMLRRRKFLEEGYNCALCQDGVEETVEHLFFYCSAAVCRWFSLGISWNAEASPVHKIHYAKLEFSQPFFMEIFMIGAWCLWNERNDFIFNNKSPSLATWKSSFKATVKGHLVRIKQNLHQSILNWLEAL